MEEPGSWKDGLRERSDALLWAVLTLLWFSRQISGVLDVDEVTYVLAGKAYFSGDLTYNAEHPPLQKLFIGIVLLFGFSEFTVRLSTLATTAGTSYIVVRMTQNLAGNRWSGWVAPAVLMLIPSYLKVASIVRLDGGLTCWVAATIYALVLYIQMDDETRTSLVPIPILREKYLCRSQVQAGWVGIFAALTFLTKYPGVFFIAVPILTVFWLATPAGTLPGKLKSMFRKSSDFVVTLISGLVVTLAIYGPFLLTGVPFQRLNRHRSHLRRGHPLTVGSTYYEVAPWWSYFYWSWSAMGFALIAVVAVVVLIAVLKKWRREDTAVGLAIVSGIVLLSVLSVRMELYLVPIWPLVVSLGVASVGRLDLPSMPEGFPLTRVVQSVLILSLLVANNNLYDPPSWNDFGTDDDWVEIVDEVDRVFPETEGEVSGVTRFWRPLQFYADHHGHEHLRWFDISKVNKTFDVIESLENEEFDFLLIPAGGELGTTDSLEWIGEDNWTIAHTFTAHGHGYEICVPGFSNRTTTTPCSA